MEKKNPKYQQKDQGRKMKMKTKTAMKNATQTSFLLSFFTVFWAGCMVVWLIGKTEIPLWAVIAMGAACVACAVWILARAIQCTRMVKDVPEDGELSDNEKNAAKRWNIIFALNGIVIGVCCALLGIFGLYEYIAPAVLLIVGLHYIPISLLYKTGIHIAVAVPTVLAATLGILSLITGTAAAYAPGLSSLAGSVGAIVLGVWAVNTVRAACVSNQTV
jgi:hypothetical protein